MASRRYAASAVRLARATCSFQSDHGGMIQVNRMRFFSSFHSQGKKQASSIGAHRLILSDVPAGHKRQIPLRLARPAHQLNISTTFSSQNSEFVDPFVTRHLNRLHIPSTLHPHIINVLQPVYGKPLTVANLQSFGPEALQALSKSLQETLPKVDENALSTRVTICVPHHKSEYELQWHEHVSLLQLCKNHPDLLGEYMEGTCGGNMSCCTCHLYLSEKMYQALPEPSEAELDMLDLAFEVESTSRLACQVYINDNILDLPPEDLQVTIPAEVVDLWA